MGLVRGGVVSKTDVHKLACRELTLQRPQRAARLAIGAGEKQHALHLEATTRTRHGGGSASDEPVLVRHHRTGPSHPFRIGKAGSDGELCTAEAALAAVRRDGGRVVTLQGPKQVAGAPLGQRSRIRLVEPPPLPQGVEASKFDDDGTAAWRGIDARFVHVVYGVPQHGLAGGGLDAPPPPTTMWTPERVRRMVDEYKSIRLLVDSPWHENLDANHRPRGVLDSHASAHASAEWGLTARYSQHIRSVKGDLRQAHPEIDAFKRDHLEPLLKDLAELAAKTMPDMARRNRAVLEAYAPEWADELAENVPWTKATAALNVRAAADRAADRAASRPHAL